MRPPQRYVLRFLATIFGLAALPLAASPTKSGIYYGLLQGDSFETSGSVRVVLTRSGHGSVSVKLGDEKTCVVMVGPVPGSWDFMMKPGGDPDMIVNLRLVEQPGGGFSVVGEVTDDGVQIPVEAPKIAMTPGGANPPLGRYNFALGKDEESDAGCGSVLINARGVVRGVLRLADGRPISVSGRIGEDGRWPLFAAAKGRASVSGDVYFAEEIDTDCAGTLRQRAPGAAASDATLALIGSAYSRSDALLPAAGQTKGVTVNVLPIGADALAFHTALNARGGFAPASLGDDQLKLNLAPATGLLTGKAVRTDGSKLALYGAVIRSKQAAGGFIAGSPGGTFHLVLDGAIVTGGGSLGAVVMTTGFESGVTFTFTQSHPPSSVGWLTQVAEPVTVPPSAGTLTLSGSNTFNGGTVINGGTLQVASGTPNLLATETIASGAVLTTGAGTLTLTGTNTYTGATVAIGGTLTLDTGVTMNWSQSDPIGALTWVGNPSVRPDALALTMSLPDRLTSFGGTMVITAPTSPATQTSFASGFRLTNEAGETIGLAEVTDGQILFINGTRYRASRPTADGALTLTFAPILIAD